MTRKKTGVFCTGVEPPETDMLHPPTTGRSKETTQVWKLVDSETWRGDDESEHLPGQCEDIWKIGGAPKMGLTPDVNLWRRNQRTSTLDLEQKIRRNMQCLCLFSLFPYDVVSLCPANATQLSYSLSLFRLLLKNFSSK